MHCPKSFNGASLLKASSESCEPVVLPTPAFPVTKQHCRLPRSEECVRAHIVATTAVTPDDRPVTEKCCGGRRERVSRICRGSGEDPCSGEIDSPFGWDSVSMNCGSLGSSPSARRQTLDCTMLDANHSTTVSSPHAKEFIPWKRPIPARSTSTQQVKNDFGVESEPLAFRRVPGARSSR